MGVARCSQSVAGPYVARVSGQSRGVAVARSFLAYGYGYTWWPGYTYGYAWRRSPPGESGEADPNPSRDEYRPVSTEAPGVQ